MLEPNDDAPSRRARLLATVALTLAAVGLGTSALLLYLHLSPAEGSCGPGGGCDLVRTSRWSMIAGVPLPALGVAYFGVLMAAVLVPRLRRRWLLALLGVGGLVSGIALLTIQGAVIGAFCPYCVVVDACSVGAGLVLAPPLASPTLRLSGGPVVGAFGLGAAVPVVLLLGAHPAVEPDAPDPLPARLVTADAGRPTIVEFIDFECPFCRRQHARMSAVLEAVAGADEPAPVEVVYKHLPLPMHPNAREAARVACCAEEQGRGPQMVDAMFARDDLSPESCQECAAEIGLDPLALQECLGSSRPDARLHADAEEARALGVRRLPTCLVGQERLVGLQEEETLRRAVERAIAGASTPS